MRTRSGCHDDGKNPQGEKSYPGAAERRPDYFHEMFDTDLSVVTTLKKIHKLFAWRRRPPPTRPIRQALDTPADVVAVN